MSDFFSRWNEVRRKLARPETVLWLFDFDGTLSPIVLRPAIAILPETVRGLLQKLARRFPHRVGIISGRPISQLIQKTGMPDLIYGGTHGFEIGSPEIRWKRPVPVVQLKRLNRLRLALQQMIKGIPGVRMENKKWTMAIHYREISPKDRTHMASILRNGRNLAGRLGFKVQDGLKAIEILSDAHWNKGQAVRRLRGIYRTSQVFYAGDDVTDETVFRILKPSDISVHVGTGVTHAEYTLKAQREIANVLRRILTL